MRINILQHTPDEGPGAISEWAHRGGHEVYTYHPRFFNGILPTADETDLLIILGGPCSPNDDDQYVLAERDLIRELIKQNKPIFGACFGAQQITKALGYTVGKSPVKEVGWGIVTLESDVISGLPKSMNVLHWHEEMFNLPKDANLLFSSEGLKNQGFELNHKVVGLQFHLESLEDNVREMVVNDYPYLTDSVFGQSKDDVLNQKVPLENKTVLFKILDYITA
ncbi:type 1 glutamine amidotransferase [Companilactobacillus ginsenosidimutans]|uniref:GMP synthase n=1 Tax=Companilactobacillus ginsenosidimutans TaxID=1007676 RepID=A0A0H4QEB1_9LACO|nr:type 1 glutamine amidotransferase [Companilactobacillus ginsenosidimutans]AKP66277.1 GMP synthase [Companilactobacillus ginsenosidimutans]